MIYDEIVKDGNNLCFDVGANIGNRTQMFLDSGYKKVIAIDPQKSCLLKLNERFNNNIKVVIVDKAVSSEEKIERIYISNADTISSMDESFIEEVKKDRFKNYNWNRYEEVMTTTLDNLIEEFGLPNFIKIDVEGYELNVLKGLSKSINYLSFEYTPELHDKSMMCIEQIELISNYKYNFSIGESLEFSLDEWINKDELDSILRSFIGRRDIHNNLLFGDIYAKKK